MEKVNIAQKFEQIQEYWKPYIAAELNGQAVKLRSLDHALRAGLDTEYRKRRK